MSGIINSVGSKSGLIGQTNIVTPHFEAYANAATAYVANGSAYKVGVHNEKFDSHGWYNNATDAWTFTPLEAGIYLIGGNVTGFSEVGVDTMIKSRCRIIKNASTVEADGYFDGRSNDWYNGTVSAQSLVSFNGSSDYVWLEHHPWAQSGNMVLNASTNFWGFKVHNL